MKTFESAVSFAQALLNLAEQNKKAGHVLEELEQLHKALNAHEQILRLLALPSLDYTKKFEIVESTFAKFLSPLTVNFLKVVVRKNHIEYLESIIHEYRELMRKVQGVSSAKVITAWPMSEELKKKLQKKLEHISSLQLELQTEVDRSLLGGAVVQIQNKQIDFSVKGKIEQLKELLTC